MGNTNGASKQPPPAPGPAPVIPSARVKRLTLASVVTGKVAGPLRIMVHGVDGVGKTVFASNSPQPIFVGTEDGTDHLDLARFPTPTSWLDLLDAIDELTTGQHSFKTMVLDTVDWAEPLLWDHVCKKAGAATIEEVSGGYGKGYTAALDDWRVFISRLERMQRDKNMGVILLAHSFIKKFQNPEGDDFDRYILKMNEKAAGLLREWCKGVYFANYETFAVKDKAKRIRGVSTGARLMYTQRTAAYDAKDRYGLPEQLPLSWEEFERGRAAGSPADAGALISEIERKAKELGGTLEAATLASLGRVGQDVSKLVQLNSWCNAKLGEKKEG